MLNFLKTPTETAQRSKQVEIDTLEKCKQKPKLRILNFLIKSFHLL
jgi:hypothetical protein